MLFKVTRNSETDNRLKERLYSKMKRAVEISLYNGSNYYLLLGPNGVERIAAAFEQFDKHDNKQPVQDLITEIKTSFHSFRQTDTHSQNDSAIKELWAICFDLYLLSAAIFPRVFKDNKLPPVAATDDQLKDNLYFLMKQAAEVSLDGGSIHYQLLGQDGLRRIEKAFKSLDKHNDQQPVQDIISEIKNAFKDLVLNNTNPQNIRAINGLKDICGGLDVLSPKIFPAANLGPQ